MHTDLFLALEKQDVQSGLYQPGRGRRSPCPQETVHKFLLQMLALTFMLGVGVGSGEGDDSVWLFLRVGLSEATGQDG